MALVLNTNIAALKAQRRVTEAQTALGVSFERLSSGLRVNSSKDDPAGLSIASRMTTQIKGMNVAVRNANDGVSLLQIAEAALDDLEASLTSIDEQYTDASNAGKDATDREYIQDEIDILLADIQRIATSTIFNTQSLLNGSFNTKKFQIGANAGQTLAVTIGCVSLNALGISLDGTATGLKKIGATVLTNGSAVTLAASNHLKIDSALDSVADIRANIGALSNRFQAVISGLEDAIDSTSAAWSRIMDVDIALETANLTKNSIIQQAAVAVLSQANQQPAVVLSLIK